MTVTRTDPLLGRLNERGFRLIMVADTLVLATVAVGSMVVRFGTDWPDYPLTVYLLSMTVIVTVFVGSLYFGGLYEREPRLGAPPALPRVARQTIAAGGLVALLTLALTGLARELIGQNIPRALPFPITNLVVLMALGAIGIAVNRRLAVLARTRREGPPKVVLVGPDADRLVAEGHLRADEDRVQVVAGVAGGEAVLEAAQRTGAGDVLLLTNDALDPLYPHAVEALERSGVAVLLRVSARETMYGLERVREIGGMPFVLLRSQTMPRSRARFKRFFDVSLIALASPFLVLLLGAVALYQLAVAGRPLLFWQERVGAGGRVFRMVKFRTMVPDAEEDGRARLAEQDDPRIVPACRWIRATRLDELPQLWNVVKGEMSLVGPRPERPELTEGFERDIVGYARRHELPPGLTGLAQIHGRYHTDPEYKLGYDLQYVVNWSPVLDLEILLRTCWVVLARRI